MITDQWKDRGKPEIYLHIHEHSFLTKEQRQFSERKIGFSTDSAGSIGNIDRKVNLNIKWRLKKLA